MIDDLLFALTFVAAIGCGLVAGIFFAFSTFVMKALARIPSADGIAAMQSINIVVINPWFMGAFFGTALACLVLVVSPLFRLNESSAIDLLIGSLLYLIGTIAVTMVFNVPRNDALASKFGMATSPAGHAGTTCGRRQRWRRRYYSPSRSCGEGDIFIFCGVEGWSSAPGDSPLATTPQGRRSDF